MKLTRLRLSQIRQFRGALEIPDLTPGLNVFCGPNEAGKSTIVRAIRAAFLERYRSGVIEDLLPSGETPLTCSPTIEVHFHALGESHALAKTFFAKKRCALTRGGVVLDGEAAEESIARLLGYGYAQKGGSRAEHWGIPGLLWIQQGDGHRVADPVGHAANHLRTALESTVGAVASTVGDGVLASLRIKRDELLTPGAGKPRGPWLSATSELTEVRSQLTELDMEIATFRDDVDRLAQLRTQQASEAAARPWEKFQEQLDLANRDLAAAERLQVTLDQSKSKEKALTTAVRLLDDQLKAFDQQRAQARHRAADRETAAAGRQTAETAAATWASRKDQAARATEAAAVQVSAAETEERRAALSLRLASATADQSRLETLVSVAAGQATDLARHQADADANKLQPAVLQTLRDAINLLREREITQRAAATTITFSLLPHVAAMLDGQVVPSASEHRITAGAQIEVMGVGRIGIVPGDNDAVELARQVEEARTAVVTTLAKLGVSSAEGAEARQERHRSATGEAKAAKQLLDTNAPKGLDRLRVDLSTATSAKESASRQLEALPPAPAEAPPPLKEAQATYQRALEAQKEANEQHSAAAQHLGGAIAREQAADREVLTLQAVVDDPKTAERERDTRTQLMLAREQSVEIAGQVAALKKQIQETQLELLRQDVKRLGTSVDQSLAAFNQRAAQIAGQAGGLEKTGAAGLEDRRAELAVREAALSRREAELALRAKALDLLTKRMESKRQALTRRLQAPLQSRLDHYLRIIFPTARLELKDDLTPGAFGHSTRSSEAAVSFEQLSHGAQEQTALISRLAYADLLKEAGKPTLLILDDALVHSDGARLEGMKRVLYDAATRHQVLLFTCHPDRWGGLGALPREIRSFVV